jgi:hypothetical protein
MADEYYKAGEEFFATIFRAYKKYDFSYDDLCYVLEGEVNKKGDSSSPDAGSIFKSYFTRRRYAKEFENILKKMGVGLDELDLAMDPSSLSTTLNNYENDIRECLKTCKIILRNGKAPPGTAKKIVKRAITITQELEAGEIFEAAKKVENSVFKILSVKDDRIITKIIPIALSPTQLDGLNIIKNILGGAVSLDSPLGNAEDDESGFSLMDTVPFSYGKSGEETLNMEDEIVNTAASEKKRHLILKYLEIFFPGQDNLIKHAGNFSYPELEGLISPFRRAYERHHKSPLYHACEDVPDDVFTERMKLLAPRALQAAGDLDEDDEYQERKKQRIVSRIKLPGFPHEFLAEKELAEIGLLIAPFSLDGYKNKSDPVFIAYCQASLKRGSTEAGKFSGLKKALKETGEIFYEKPLRSICLFVKDYVQILFPGRIFEGFRLHITKLASFELYSLIEPFSDDINPPAERDAVLFQACKDRSGNPLLPYKDFCARVKVVYDCGISDADDFLEEKKYQQEKQALILQELGGIFNGDMPEFLKKKDLFTLNRRLAVFRVKDYYTPDNIIYIDFYKRGGLPENQETFDKLKVKLKKSLSVTVRRKGQRKQSAQDQNN